jgi:hypothetical protein
MDVPGLSLLDVLLKQPLPYILPRQPMLWNDDGLVRPPPLAIEPLYDLWDALGAV